MSVNLRGTFLVLRAVLPRLGSGGAVTIASLRASAATACGAAYTSTKGGVIAVRRSRAT